MKIIPYESVKFQLEGRNNIHKIIMHKDFILEELNYQDIIMITSTLLRKLCKILIKKQ